MNRQTRILGISGSLRRESYNSAALRAAAELAPEGATIEIFGLDGIPLFNQDEERNPSARVMELKRRVREADALLFVTPEYNYSVPGVLKNAIDIGSRPYGKSVWAGKPAGIIGITPGSIGTACAQQHLRTICAYLDMPVLGQPEVFLQAKDGLFEASGDIGANSREFLQGWMDRYVAWVKQHSV
jgi:chromate reductase